MLPRFYWQNLKIQNDLVNISDSQIIYQITKILRLKIGDVLIVFDAQYEYQILIENITKDGLTGKIIEKTKSEREPSKKLILYQSLLKSDKLEWILQKGVEIGVAEFTPIISDNCVVRETSENKLARYKKIIQEATEQCGGLKVASLKPILTFKQAMEQTRNVKGQKLLAWEGQVGQPLSKTLDKNQKEYHLLIGPEGGFSPEEVELAKRNGMQIVSLGKRILRAETAAIVASSLILLS
jgi:16S rRNA (uracil1498-N3)-methyltransferase